MHAPLDAGAEKLDANAADGAIGCFEKHLRVLRRKGTGVNQPTPFLGDALHKRLAKLEASDMRAWHLGGECERHGDAQRLLGVIPLEAIRPHINDPDLATLVIARDLLDESFPVTTADSSVTRAIELFSRRMCERLPVVDKAQRRALLGTISKTDILLALAKSNRSRGAKNNAVATTR